MKYLHTKSIQWILISVWLIGSSQSIPKQRDSIVVQNYYYPKPGNEDKVLQLRPEASTLRQRLALPRSRILRRINGDGGSFLIWECEYATLDIRNHDLEVLDESAEFKLIVKKMDSLLIRFERGIFTIE